MGLFSKKPEPDTPSAKTAPKPQVQTMSPVQPKKPIMPDQSAQKMKAVTETIRMADNMNDLLIGTAAKTKEALNADRITIYVVDSMHNVLSSRIKDGTEVKAIMIPISNNSIAGYIAKNSKSVNIKDAYDNNELQQSYAGLHFDRSWDEKTGFRTKQVLGIPVVLKGKIQGVIQAINKKSAAEGSVFSESDMQLIQDIADSLAPDLNKIKSFEDGQREIELHKKIKRVTDKIHSALHIDDVLQNITEDLLDIFEIESLTIFMLDKETSQLVSRYWIKDGVQEIKITLDNCSLAGFAAKNNQVISIADVYNESELIKISPEIRFDKRWDEKFGKRTRNIVAFPLIFGGSVNGVIQLINKKFGFLFSDNDIETAREIATTLGIALSRQKKVAGVKRSKYDSLVAGNLVAQEKLDEILKKSKETGDTLEQILSKEHGVSIDAIGKCYQLYFRTDFIKFDKEIQIPVNLIQDLTLDTLKNEMWVPIDKTENTIRVAMEDPNDIVKRDTIHLRFKSADIKYCVSTKDNIVSIIDLFYGVSKTDESTPGNVDNILDELKEESADKTKEEESKSELKEDDSAIVRLVNQIIEQAYALKASDIHVEPYTETDTIIRLRVDGVCQEMMKIPKHYKNALSSRIKIMSGLDIAERRIPQDGKIKFKNFGKLDIELRVATIPTVAGNEDVVMRILAASKPMPLDKMGISEPNLIKFKEILNKPYGICLVVGPTGSGKTTTLHSALGFINTPDMKIWTAEDPVEITQYQLRQVQVHPKIGFTFEKAMRAFLRGDPDVIMVGEMRDLETTSTGVEASLTGHLVFSTLHTNNAPETITRLLDMGIDPFSFADALLGILAQRLIRTLCKDCKEEFHPSEKEFKILRFEYGNDEMFDSKFKYTKDLYMFRAKEGGCPKCSNRGYRGRMGIHELLTTSDEVKAMIHKKPKAAELTALVIKEGMITLKQDGIEKIFAGFSALPEVLSVCMK
jgi:type II secretory ATPase GspE/PulE/Tfp pilus assembly ATPase PilB-like protein/GAF domain-containing protein